MNNKRQTLIEHYLIGIDDTDNLETKGTGFRAREIAKLIINKLGGLVHNISRHQLFFDPRIPFTSHNSSLCLDVTTDKIEAVKQSLNKIQFKIGNIFTRLYSINLSSSTN